MNVFPAKYPGTCADCGGRFAPGDPVRYEALGSSRLAHDDCDAGEFLVAEREPCDRCFIVPALSGACGCD